MTGSTAPRPSRGMVRRKGLFLVRRKGLFAWFLVTASCSMHSILKKKFLSMEAAAGLRSKGFYVNIERLAKYGEAMEEDYGEMSVEESYTLLLNADLRKVCSSVCSF